MKCNLTSAPMYLAAILCIAVAGCHKDETPVVNTTAPAQTAETAPGSKPAGGAVFTPTHVPAPAGLQTGNYAGGKKD